MKFKATISRKKSALLLECVQGFVKMLKGLSNKQTNRFYMKFEKDSLLFLLISHLNFEEQILDVSCRIKYEDIFIGDPIIESKNNDIIGISLNPDSLILPLKSSILAKETTMRLSKRESHNVLSFSMAIETKKLSTFQLIHDCKIEVLKSKIVNGLVPIGDDKSRFDDEMPNIYFSTPSPRSFLRLLEKMKLVDSKYIKVEILQNEQGEALSNASGRTSSPTCCFICTSDNSLDSTVSIKTFFNNCIVFKTENGSKTNSNIAASELNENELKSINLLANYDINHFISILQLVTSIPDSYSVVTITQHKYLSLLVFFPNIKSQISIFLAPINTENVY
ncbi:Hus1-like mitotic and DNA damage checkpoint [Cryptosporidium xiaoi]|uniref:Hus1-like mitotic and DNA damage checkpoint n=1 Tax=Cryptosporidium xiaoi TaxID=659607 RepID=A0AAV9XX11_9CRYT